MPTPAPTDTIDIDFTTLDVTQAEELLERLPGRNGKGRPPGPRQFNRDYQIIELWGKHREMIRLHVLGLPGKEIANMLGVTPACVSYVLNSKLGRERAESIQAEADGDTAAMNKRFRETASEAQGILEKIMSDEDTEIRLKAKVAMDQLDRAGLAPVKRVEAKIALGIFDGRDVAEMCETADEMREDALKVAQENGNLAQEG